MSPMFTAVMTAVKDGQTEVLPGTKHQLSGPQSRSRHCEEEKNLLPLVGIEPHLSSPSLY
jgi:hypothetical protein